LILRCKSCHGTVWAQPERGSRRLELSCRGCKQRYHLEPRQRDRIAGRSFAKEARELAQDEGIDLPGAYSVLLGVMTLEELRAYMSPRKIDLPEPAAAGASAGPDAELPYDPAFQAAVESGFLTARQAGERGHREMLATSLAGRHGLPLKLAYAVADNRLSLVEALRKRDAAREQPLNLTVPAGPSPRAIGLFLALAACGALALALESWNRPAPVTRALGQAEMKVDHRGRLLRVAGPDPQTVLETYCAAGEAGPCRVLAVVPASSAGGRARIGLIRPSDDRGALLAITIEEDKAAGLWFAGDGETPIAVRSAPEGAEAALRAKRAEDSDSAESAPLQGRD
jgi:hypothetical protein